MTGWLLIFTLLILGGVLSTLGDRLGSLVGKARLSIFKLRPKSSAVLITVFTGSLISAFSLGFMLLVDSDLRVGLFEIKKLRAKEKLLEGRVKYRESQLREFEKNVIALRSGNMVISKDQILASSVLELNKNNQIRKEINYLIKKANTEAMKLVLPDEIVNQRVVFILKEDVSKLERLVKKEGSWVVNVRSLANVLFGEKRVLAFFEIGPNIEIVKKGEVIAKTQLQIEDISVETLNRTLKLLLASTKSEVKRKGSLSTSFLGKLSPELNFNSKTLRDLREEFESNPNYYFILEAVSLRSSNTSEPIDVLVQLRRSFENNP